MGGLSRRAYVVDRLKQTAEHPPLFIDSGNLLYKKNSSEKLEIQDRLAAHAIQDIYRTMQYTAVAVGPRDLLGGVDDLLAGLLKGTPWVSANIMSDNGHTVFPPWVIKETAGLRVGIIGLTSQTAAVQEPYRIVPWSQVIPDAIDRLSPSCDFLIVLSNLDDETNKAVAAGYPEVNILISANSRVGNMIPAIFNNTLFTQTLSRGKYLGSLTINWTTIPFWKESHKSGRELKEAFLESAGKRLSDDNKEKLRKRTAEINQFSSDEILSHSRTFTQRFRALPMRLPESAEVKRIISKLQEDITRENKAITPESSAISLNDSFSGSIE